MLKFKISYLSKIYIMINYQKLFSKKTFIILGFVAFSLFWFGDFMWAFFYMIVFPIVFYVNEKNNSKIEDIAENHSYVVFITVMITISYIIFSAHYLSVQNPNKIFNKNTLVMDTYYLPEYKTVRTRSDSQLWVKNSQGLKAINCSVISYGNCPYAYDYGNHIDIGFIEIRKNFYRFISGRGKPSIAYYLKFGDEVITSEYFIKKYDKEMKRIYKFLISLNLYIIFLFFIKKTYNIILIESFFHVLSNKKYLVNLILSIVITYIYPIVFIFL